MSIAGSMREWNERMEERRKKATEAYLAHEEAREATEVENLRAENNLLRFCLKNCTCLEQT